MIRFIAFGSAAAFLLCVWVGDPGMMFAGGALLMVVALFACRDLASLMRHVQALTETREGPVSLSGERDAVFAKVERSFTSLEGLAYRLNALEWQIHHLSSHGLDSAPSFLPKEIKEGGREVELKEVFPLLLEGLGKRLRADGCALILLSDASEPEVLMSGVEGVRYEHTLRRFARAFTLRNQVGILGHRKTDELPLLVDEFQFFGIHELLSMPFKVLDRAGIIVLAYRAYHSPTEVEKKIVRYFIRELEQEVPSLLKMRELSGRISEAESLSKEKSDFLAQMSHDIRSPLNNIKASLNFLKTLNPDAESEEILDIASANCDSLTELLTTILDFSRHQSGKLEAFPTAFDVVGEIMSLVEGFKVTARLQGIELKTEYPRFERPKIYADKTHTKRILSNLLSNAIKFTEHGTVTVKVARSDGKYTAISVKDTGCGMSKQQIQKLFVPFTRFQGAKREGIGLGLAVTKLLSELNGGRVVVESEEGVGTTFAVYLRDAAASGSSAGEPASNQVSSTVTGQQNSNVITTPAAPRAMPRVSKCHSIQTVLVVDDDAATVRALKRTLEHAGFRVLEATSLKSAVSLVNFEGADCILADLHLMDGTARELLTFMRSRKMSIPTCVISGDTRPEVRNELLALGAAEIFEKPLQAKLLMAWLLSCEIEQEVA